MMNIIQNIMNMYKTDPIKFFMMIAIVYLLLKQSNVIENLKPSKVQGEVNLQALSTVSQLAQKWNNAVEIDNTGNVTFKNNVTNQGNLIVDGKVGIGTNNPASKLDVKGGWDSLFTLTPDGQNDKPVKFTTGSNNFGIWVGNNKNNEALKLFHNDGKMVIGGEVKGNTMNFGDGKIISKPDGKMKVFNKFWVVHPTNKSFMGYFPGEADAFRVMRDIGHNNGKYSTITNNGDFWYEPRHRGFDHNPRTGWRPDP